MAWYHRWFGTQEQPLQLEDMSKALPEARAARPPKPQSWTLDPGDYGFSYNEADQSEAYHPGTFGLDYDTLRSMARVPVISAIIQTRIGQVAEFGVPARGPYDIGFRIRLRDREKEPNGRQKKEIRELTRWMCTCGDTRIPGNVSLENFLRMVVRDSLVFDQLCFEIVRNKGGGIAGFVPVDASTIRRAKVRDSERKRGRRIATEDSYVQIINQKPIQTFTAKEMCFGVRRPRTWIKINGYGYPELEELVRVITDLVNAESFNSANFTHGMHVAGILAVKSKMNPQLFRAFRREFYAMLSGAQNAKKTPIIQLDPDAKEELQSVNMSQSNRDMEFGQWMSYLLKLATTIYGMDPAELSFVYGAEGQTHQLNQKSPMDRITVSKERGLRPLLRSVSGWLNTHVLSQIDEDYVLEFVGFDAQSESEKMDLDIKSVKAFRTVNEIRAMHDLDPIDSPVADMILDPTYINTAWQMSMQEEEGEGEEAPPGMGGDDFDFDFESLFSQNADMFGGGEPAGGGQFEQEPEPEPEPEELGKSLLRTIEIEVD
jgi:hypothetical protein